MSMTRCDLDLAVTVVDNAKTQKYSPATPPRACWWRAPWRRPFAAHRRRLRRQGRGNAGLREGRRALLARRAGAKLVPPPRRTGARNTWRPVISVKGGGGLDEAIAWINRYGSHHTDAILTTDHRHAAVLREVDSASVMVNASTRFADGFEYGLGAGSASAPTNSTRRGPVGMEG